MTLATSHTLASRRRDAVAPVVEVGWAACGRAAPSGKVHDGWACHAAGECPDVGDDAANAPTS